MVLVVIFSAAPSDPALARVKATTADNFSFIEMNPYYLRWCDYKEAVNKFQSFGALKCLGKLPEESPPHNMQKSNI